MRTFIAVELPQTVRAGLVTLQGELAKAQADVKWVEPENLHLTLKFLGEITDEQRQAIESLLKRVADHEEPFTLGLGGVGAFPSVTAPRVIWVGLGEGEEPVARVAQMIEEGGRAIGLRREERPFATHLTLGRVRSSRRRTALAQLLRETTWEPPSPWRVTSITLYQSVLGPGGPRYTVLADIPLKIC
jgi:2'-5' RNA ligase